MTTDTKIRPWPDLAIHPGATLGEELEARALSYRQAAEIVGVSPRVIGDVVRGRRRIDAGLALALERALGVDARFWMNLQSDYDLTVAYNQQKDRGAA